MRGGAGQGRALILLAALRLLTKIILYREFLLTMACTGLFWRSCAMISG